MSEISNIRDNSQVSLLTSKIKAQELNFASIIFHQGSMSY